jgi:hypothetical protein
LLPPLPLPVLPELPLLPLPLGGGGGGGGGNWLLPPLPVFPLPVFPLPVFPLPVFPLLPPTGATAGVLLPDCPPTVLGPSDGALLEELPELPELEPGGQEVWAGGAVVVVALWTAGGNTSGTADSMLRASSCSHRPKRLRRFQDLCMALPLLKLKSPADCLFTASRRAR